MVAECVAGEKLRCFWGGNFGLRLEKVHLKKVMHTPPLFVFLLLAYLFRPRAAYA